MAFTKIKEEELVNRGVVGLPDRPSLSTLDMQKKFDELARDVIIPKFNEFLEELESSILDTMEEVKANEEEGKIAGALALKAYMKYVIENFLPLTGAKPSGSYTGDGSSDVRIISIGGSGYCCLIWSDEGSVIATPTGALWLKQYDVTPLSIDECTFSNGTLYMGAPISGINYDGTVYNYAVL